MCWVSSEHGSSSHSVRHITRRRTTWKKSFLVPGLRFLTFERTQWDFCATPFQVCSPSLHAPQDVGTSASPKQTQHLLLPGSRWRQPMAELPLKLANPARVFHCLSGHWFVKSTVDTSVCQTEHHRWPTFPSLNFILLTPKSSMEHTPPILFC